MTGAKRGKCPSVHLPTSCAVFRSLTPDDEPVDCSPLMDISRAAPIERAEGSRLLNLGGSTRSRRGGYFAVC